MSSRRWLELDQAAPQPSLDSHTPPSCKVSSAWGWSPLAERLHLAETQRRGRTGVQGVSLHPQLPDSMEVKEGGLRLFTPSQIWRCSSSP